MVTETEIRTMQPLAEQGQDIINRLYNVTLQYTNLLDLDQMDGMDAAKLDPKTKDEILTAMCASFDEVMAELKPLVATWYNIMG